jgi:hypothetical protein
MPAVPTVLGELVKQKVREKFYAFGTDPLAQRLNRYYINFTEAIGQGIAAGTPSVQFTTADTGFKGLPPVPGAGTGIGMQVDTLYMTEKIYTEIRNAVLKRWRTNHDVWPPRENNSGRYLRALSEGIAEAVQEHYNTCWILTSVHPIIYAGTGVINPAMGSNFSGIADSAVASQIQAFGTLMRGPFWPDLCQAIAKGYQDGIHNKTLGQVTIIGVCVITESQLCNIPGVGVGTGVAS